MKNWSKTKVFTGTSGKIHIGGKVIEITGPVTYSMVDKDLNSHEIFEYKPVDWGIEHYQCLDCNSTWFLSTLGNELCMCGSKNIKRF